MQKYLKFQHDGDLSGFSLPCLTLACLLVLQPALAAKPQHSERYLLCRFIRLRRFLLNYILPSIVRAQKDSLKGQEQLSIMLATRPPCEKVPERLSEAPKTQHGMYSSLPGASLDASVDPSSPFICVHLWHESRPIQRTECHLHISAMQNAAPFVPSSLVPGRQMVARLRSAECAIMCRRRAQG